MSVASKRRVVEEVWSSFNRGDFDTLGSLYHPAVAYHGSGGLEIEGRDGVVALSQEHKSAFPDMRAELEQTVAEGDLVVSRVRGIGTNTGELMGMPPTGKAVDLRWFMVMQRVVDDQIVEEWAVNDQLDFMRQLGMAG